MGGYNIFYLSSLSLQIKKMKKKKGEKRDINAAEPCVQLFFLIVILLFAGFTGIDDPYEPPLNCEASIQ